MSEQHEVRFQQHPMAWTWRAACSCGFRGYWRGDADCAHDDYGSHRSGDDREGHYPAEASR